MMQYNSSIESLSYSTLLFSRYNVMSFEIFTTQVFWDVVVLMEKRFPKFRRNVSS